MYVTIRGPSPEVVFLDLDTGDITGSGQVCFDRVDISGTYTISHPACSFTECQFSSGVTSFALGSAGSFSECYSTGSFALAGEAYWSFYNCTLALSGVGTLIAGAFTGELQFFNCTLGARTAPGGSFIVGLAGLTLLFRGCTIALNNANSVVFGAGTVLLNGVQFVFGAGFTYTFNSGAGVTYSAPVAATIQGVPIGSLVTAPAGIWVNDGANAIIATP